MGQWNGGRHPKMWKICVTSSMDGPLGCVTLARLNRSPVSNPPSRVTLSNGRWILPMNSCKCLIKSTHFEPVASSIITSAQDWEGACPKHIDTLMGCGNGTVKWGRGQKLCKICSTSPMDGALGYITLARFNFSPVSSSIVGNLKQWPMNPSYELIQAFHKEK